VCGWASEAMDVAKARWELENQVQTVADVDALYRHDEAEQKAIQAQKPWTKDPHYFKQCVKPASPTATSQQFPAVPLLWLCIFWCGDPCLGAGPSPLAVCACQR
jgi:hypothetical protein